ncbi:MFS transporter [Roseateles amylovorans]|uniref:MFS transporter n=1 Tax=Roseateles amylovorans TaxID=2978473 RepID=A0ABY6B7P9_9BURK|nr:MFS transporter [Roseateles amylovorans]UXH79580.1 MFS transporter [Roseateles amylovorans]
MILSPVPQVSDEQLAQAQRVLVRESAWASMIGSLSGGVVLVSFALSLGAGPLLIGLLAALPFAMQVLQLPATLLVERLRLRKRLSIFALAAARVVILALAALPLMEDKSAALAWLLAAQFAITSTSAVAGCAINSWFHQLLPPQSLGSFFSRRLLAATLLASLCTLGMGLLSDRPPMGDVRLAYVVSFLVAGLASVMSTVYLSRTPEPQMLEAGPPGKTLNKLKAPFLDRNFRRVLVLLGSWNLATNFSAPFLTVYLLQQLQYGLGTVTALWVTAQAANALTLLSWGRVSDRLSNKAILAVALPLYFICALGLVFTRVGEPYGLQLALLFGVHLLMGAASGGIGLATGNLGLKLAPQGQGTAYLAAVGLVCAVAGGMAPILAGLAAEWFQSRQLSVVVRWVSPVAVNEVSVLRFAHIEFLFAASAAMGLYVMHALSRVKEGTEVSERRVVQELGLEAMRSAQQLSSIGGALGSLFPFERLTERRLFGRPRASRGGRPGSEVPAAPSVEPH